MAAAMLVTAPQRGTLHPAATGRMNAFAAALGRPRVSDRERRHGIVMDLAPPTTRGPTIGLEDVAMTGFQPEHALLFGGLLAVLGGGWIMLVLRLNPRLFLRNYPAANPERRARCHT